MKTSRNRVLSTALIVFCPVVLLLSTGGFLFYRKMSKRCVFWSRVSQKDDGETEMCKQTSRGRERDEEEEEKRFTISSETMLYANAQAKVD
ncbi:hypothetical protein WMY93_030308 [Mugilogobius chulae]|uniref:Transmembrane protein n=1 Tax=Mugilogobius chulae TaxID=88201 RepID=A0AAW0MY94_9GOBI